MTEPASEENRKEFVWNNLGKMIIGIPMMVGFLILAPMVFLYMKNPPPLFVWGVMLFPLLVEVYLVTKMEGSDLTWNQILSPGGAVLGGSFLLPAILLNMLANVEAAQTLMFLFPLLIIPFILKAPYYTRIVLDREKGLIDIQRKTLAGTSSRQHPLSEVQDVFLDDQSSAAGDGTTYYLKFRMEGDNAVSLNKVSSTGDYDRLKQEGREIASFLDIPFNEDEGSVDIQFGD